MPVLLAFVFLIKGTELRLCTLYLRGTKHLLRRIMKCGPGQDFITESMHAIYKLIARKSIFPKKIYINVNKGEILLFKKQIVENQSPTLL